MHPLLGHEVVANIDKVGIGGKSEDLKLPIEKPAKQEMPGMQKGKEPGPPGSRAYPMDAQCAVIRFRQLD